MANYEYIRRIKQLGAINDISFVPAKLRNLYAQPGGIPDNAFVTETNQDFISEDGKFFIKEQ